MRIQLAQYEAWFHRENWDGLYYSWMSYDRLVERRPETIYRGSSRIISGACGRILSFRTNKAQILTTAIRTGAEEEAEGHESVYLGSDVKIQCCTQQ